MNLLIDSIKEFFDAQTTQVEDATHSLSQLQMEQTKFDDFTVFCWFWTWDDKDVTDLLAAGTYLRLRFHGTHSTVTENYRKMLDYCEKHNYQITGYAIEIALLDYGITDDVEKYVIEIRILLRNYYFLDPLVF